MKQCFTTFVEEAHDDINSSCFLLPRTLERHQTHARANSKIDWKRKERERGRRENKGDATHYLSDKSRHLQPYKLVESEGMWVINEVLYAQWIG